MFSPALQLAQDDQACNHLPRQHDCSELNPQDIFFQSSDNTTLQAVFVENPTSDRLIIYFHGNGSHVYYRLRFAVFMVNIANVFILSYRGYGKSTGTPSERGLFADAEASIQYAMHTLGFAENKIYIYGRSLGSSVAIHSAQNRSIAGLVLVSAFSSGYDLAHDRGLEKIPGLTGQFNSMLYLHNVHVPILFIHGNRDHLIPMHHSEKLYASYHNNTKEFYTLHDANHWNIHRIGGDALWERINRFVNPESAASTNTSTIDWEPAE